MVRSFSQVLQPTLGETCYPSLLELYSELRCLGCACLLSVGSWVQKGGPLLRLGCALRAAGHRARCPGSLPAPTLATAPPYPHMRSRPPPVILSEDLVEDPEGTLRALCAALDLPFQPQVGRSPLCVLSMRARLCPLAATCSWLLAAG